jgi:hypothetical protein
MPVSFGSTALFRQNDSWTTAPQVRLKAGMRETAQLRTQESDGVASFGIKLLTEWQDIRVYSDLGG